jgi:hypothetical protein
LVNSSAIEKVITPVSLCCRSDCRFDSFWNFDLVMSMDSDWRLQGQERYLQGVRLFHRQYHSDSKNPHWDHDHCEFCFAKFMVADHPEALHEGYCTEDEYRWVCSQCLADFRERFKWSVTGNV